jgi:hypothetical protein
MTRRPIARRRLHTFVAAALAAVLLSSTVSLACGPFTLEAIFVHTVHPGFPLERYAAGHVGVVQPSYARSYLYVAYRYLSGGSFSAAEQKALTELWKERLGLEGPAAGDDEWTKSWLAARKKVVAQDPAPISVYRSREKPNEYESYLNCQKDAFDTAIATLEQRIAKYGAESTQAKTWVEGQDQVFSNCGGGSSIPAQLPGDADALARADRAYQIAAANFYSTNLDEARKDFEAIAADANSPWQHNAVYLVARALIRKASLGPAEQKQESLSQAESQLKKILADKKLSSLHAASTRLLNLVRLRLHPAERLRELAQALTAKTVDPNLKQDLWDYTTLLDSFLEADDETKARELPREDDLTDWLVTLQGEKDSLEHALSRWQATHANTWLIAALSHVDSKHPQAPQLMEAALNVATELNVKSNSAAFITTRFHAIRLLAEFGKSAEARNLIDELLKIRSGQLDQSTLNLLASQRLATAATLAEFLADAAHVPAALSWNDDGREVPTDEEEGSDATKSQKGKPFFDVDAAHAINQQLPLSVLKEAAKATALPAGPRRDLVQATWLRAALLGDTKTAEELAPILTKLVPQLAESLSTYQLSTDPDEKKFAAIFAWLKAPGLEPVVDAGIGREMPLMEQDSYRDNWWCTSYIVPATAEENSEVVQFTATTTNPPPRFLSPQEVERGAKEWAALRALGTAPNYISKQVIQWANTHPNDPRVPEALHLAVKTTRYGCTDKDTARWSKAAYDLLHRKYPNSPWTKKTPYWFKD